jgi:hypothetical protein
VGFTDAMVDASGNRFLGGSGPVLGTPAPDVSRP